MAHSFSRRLAAAAAAAAIALPVLAQPQPQPSAPVQATAAAAAATEAAQGRSAQPSGEQKRRHFQERRERRQAHRAQRMQALKADLQLTPAQESAWATYTAALQPGERHARLDRKDLAQLTTPERIDRMRALRAQRSAEADRRGEATKAFYAALTPEQQKTFDARAHRMHPQRGKHAGEGRHHHHHRPHDGQKRHHGQHHERHQPGSAAAPAAPAPAR